MEELTEKRLPVIVTDGGRATDDYHLRTANAHDPEKHKTREKIAEFFLESPYAGEWGPTFTLLTLPGKLWVFERMFIRMCSAPMQKRLFFNGLEWSWPILEQGVAWMPRRSRRRKDRAPATAHYGLNTGRIMGFATTYARWMHIHSDTYMQIEKDDLKHDDRHRWFEHTFWGNSVIWLDFTSNACPVVMDTLINAGNCCRLPEQPVHFATSFMVGRDVLDLEPKGDALSTRVHFVETCMNLNKHKTFELVDAWTYQSVGGVTMANVIGKLHHRRTNGKEEKRPEEKEGQVRPE